jgi:hypothetical protein
MTKSRTKATKVGASDDQAKKGTKPKRQTKKKKERSSSESKSKVSMSKSEREQLEACMAGEYDELGIEVPY